MPPRHRRIVPLENLARQAVGLPTLRRVAPHLFGWDQVHNSDSATISLSGRSHGSSRLSGSLTVERRLDFEAEVAAFSAGALTGSLLWAVAGQEGPFGGIVGGIVGYCYRSWRS